MALLDYRCCLYQLFRSLSVCRFRPFYVARVTLSRR